MTVLWAISSPQLSFLHHWHNVCFFNLLWGWSEDKSWNLVIMDDAVKLPTWMRWLSPLFWCLCVVEHCHTVGGHFWLRSWVSFIRFLLWASSGSQCMPQSQPERTVNRIFQGKDTYSHSKVEHCYWEKQWLCWEVGMWSRAQLHFDIWHMFFVGNYSCTKEKGITF